jgi:hypothetical protein
MRQTTVLASKNGMFNPFLRGNPPDYRPTERKIASTQCGKPLALGLAMTASISNPTNAYKIIGVLTEQPQQAYNN